MTRYEPHCDCLGGHVSMVPDPNGRWCRADDPRAVADDPSGIVQQMPEGAGDVLAPCPFCGAPAEIVHIDGGELAGGSCVTCTKCLACSNVEFEFKENFVSNWNRRATEADLRAEVERLRSALIPFASAWRIARASGLTSMVVLGQLARNEVAAVSFLRASAALYPETDGGQDAPADS